MSTKKKTPAKAKAPKQKKAKAPKRQSWLSKPEIASASAVANESINAELKVEFTRYINAPDSDLVNAGNRLVERIETCRRRGAAINNLLNSVLKTPEEQAAEAQQAQAAADIQRLEAERKAQQEASNG